MSIIRRDVECWLGKPSERTLRIIRSTLMQVVAKCRVLECFTWWYI